MRRAFVIVLSLTLPAGVFSQETDFDKSAQAYLDKLEQSPAPVFSSACRTKSGKAILIFGGSNKEGMLFELRGVAVVNSAKVIVGDKGISLDTEETQGGIYTYTIMTNRAEDLSRKPFQLSSGKQVKGIFKGTSGSTCEDKPPK